MTHSSKRKGNAYEREIVRAAEAAGLDARRAYASNGEALGQHAECDVLVAGQAVQAKRRKALPQWIVDALANVDAVAMRGDRGESLVVLRLDDWLRLLGGRDERAGTQDGPGADQA